MKIAVGILGLLYKIYIAIIFSTSLLLFYLPIVALKSSKKTKKYTFQVFIMWSWLFRIIAFIHVKYTHRADIPDGPYIILANHASYFDIFLLHSILPKHPFLFLGKAEILKYPLMKSFFKSLNIPVFRANRLKAAQSFIQAKRALEEDWSLAIFPEGGIPDHQAPRMQEFKDGAFKLAKSSGVPIVCLTFQNNYKLFSDLGEIFGLASPGISKVYQHETIGIDLIHKMSVEELKIYCFNIISSQLYEKI